MERVKTSKATHILQKLAVKETEPGLSTGQLMLINEDLKPGMPQPLLVDCYYRGSFTNLGC